MPIIELRTVIPAHVPSFPFCPQYYPEEEEEGKEGEEEEGEEERKKKRRRKVINDEKRDGRAFAVGKALSF